MALRNSSSCAVLVAQPQQPPSSGRCPTGRRSDGVGGAGRPGLVEVATQRAREVASVITATWVAGSAPAASRSRPASARCLRQPTIAAFRPSSRPGRPRESRRWWRQSTFCSNFRARLRELAHHFLEALLCAPRRARRRRGGSRAAVLSTTRRCSGQARAIALLDHEVGAVPALRFCTRSVWYSDGSGGQAL